MARVGQPRSPETRAKQSARARERWSRASERAAQSDRARAMWADPNGPWTALATRRGEQSHAWRGGETRKDGYVYVHRPGHPMAGRNGYVVRHRLVMAEHLGRVLTASDIVHHINGVRGDDRLENLILMTRGAHISHHNTGKVRRGQKHRRTAA